MSGVRHCVIRVDGNVYEQLYEDLVAVEVSERVGEPSSFALQVAIFKMKQGGWTRLDETSAANGVFAPWQRITIAVGFDNQPDVLIDGYVAGVAPRFEAVEANSHVLVWGYDASYAMDIEEKVVAWPNSKYSDIATQLFQANGLTPGTIVDTQVQNDANKELLIQRGTDWRFLKQLADRVGYTVSARGGTGNFRPPDLSQTPQKDLAVAFGRTLTNVVWFEPRVVGDMPTKVQLARANTLAKTVEKVQVTDSPLRPLGARNGDALRAGRSIPSQPVTLGTPEPVVADQAMEAMATGIRRQNDWIVTGEGEIDGMVYARALRSDGVVLIKGAGKTFSGRYYVTEVTHRITPEAYTQRFKVKRNGLDLQGDEPFQSPDADPTAPAGNDDRTEVRPTGTTVSS